MSRNRRSEDPLLVVLLTGVPWWSVPVAAAVTAALIFWLDLSGNPWGKGLEPFWWAWAAMIGLVFLGGWWRGYRRRRLVDKTDSLDQLRALPWRDFEMLVAEAYRRRGWRVTERGGAEPTAVLTWNYGETMSCSWCNASGGVSV